MTEPCATRSERNALAAIVAACGEALPPPIHPVRQKRVPGARPRRNPIIRGCATCDADFLALAPGLTGERGIWRDWSWYCSVECDSVDAGSA